MKRNTCWIALALIVLLSCEPSAKMGKTKLGEDGKVLGGTGKRKCTYPRKRYARELDAVIKANFDSLAKLPIGNVEIGVKTKVTQLAQNTPEGLDVELIMFYTCEIANNLGFSKEQGERLINETIQAWKAVKGSKSVTIINNGYNSGIMAEKVEITQDAYPTENNFTVEPYDFKEDRTYNAVICKPKVGTWLMPFFAYPRLEDSLVKGEIVSAASSSNIIDNGYYEMDFNNKSIAIKVMKCSSGGSASNTNGYIFLFKKKPSVLWFGDWGNTQKSYSVQL